MAFIKGKSGNPAGRPKGSQDKRRQLRTLLEMQAEPIIQKLIDLALQNDVQALKLCVERLVPRVNGDPVCLPNYQMDTIEQLLVANSKVGEAVFNGDVPPKTGLILSQIVSHQQKLIELIELEKRISNLEKIIDKNSN